MTSNTMTAIEEQLQSQKELLAAEAAKLRYELSEKEQYLARINVALAALSGEPLPSASTKLAKRDVRKPIAPSASKAQVIDLMLEELSQSSSLHEAQLKARIEQKLIESGHSRMGYSRRFKEALADARR